VAGVIGAGDFRLTEAEAQEIAPNDA